MLALDAEIKNYADSLVDESGGVSERVREIPYLYTTVVEIEQAFIEFKRQEPLRTRMERYAKYIITNCYDDDDDKDTALEDHLTAHLKRLQGIVVPDDPYAEERHRIALWAAEDQLAIERLRARTPQPWVPPFKIGEQARHRYNVVIHFIQQLNAGSIPREVLDVQFAMFRRSQK